MRWSRRIINIMLRRVHALASDPGSTYKLTAQESLQKTRFARRIAGGGEPALEGAEVA